MKKLLVLLTVLSLFLVTGCKKAPTAPEGPKTSTHAYSFDVSVVSSNPTTTTVTISSVCQGISNTSTITIVEPGSYSRDGIAVTPTPDTGSMLTVSVSAVGSEPGIWVGLTMLYDGGPYNQVSGNNGFTSASAKVF